MGETLPPSLNVVTAPEALLPVSKLKQYLGPSVLQTALALPVGGVSQPIASTGGYHVVRVLEREDDAVPPFETVRAAVRAEVVRRRGETALHQYLKQLRAEADVVTCVAPGVEDVGVLVRLGVSVHQRDGDQHRVPGLDGLAADIDVLLGHPDDVVGDGGEPQQLFDHL